MMADYLILRLQGATQAWGDHSFEGLRPASFIPTKSGILGLLGACLGIRRNDRGALEKLNNCLAMAVQVETRKIEKTVLQSRIMTDYHTVKNARDGYRGLKSHDTIITRREYFSDCQFSVALWTTQDGYTLDELESAVKKPVFTPFLGRRSCPLGEPLFWARLTASSEFSALRQVTAINEGIYSETNPRECLPAEKAARVRSIKVRDIPLSTGPRQFSSRLIYAYGGKNVPE